MFPSTVFFTLSPKIRHAEATMKNLALRLATDATVNLQALRRKAPLEMVKILYGMGVKPAMASGGCQVPGRILIMHHPAWTSYRS